MRFVIAIVTIIASCAPSDLQLHVAGRDVGEVVAGDEYGIVLVELPRVRYGPAWACAACVGAAQGDVVDIRGLSVPSAPDPGFLPATLSQRALVFSDSPESPSTSGVLARADLHAGDARLFAWHANGFDGGAKRVVIVVENTNDTSLSVALDRFAVTGPTTSYVSAGQGAVRTFLHAPESASKVVAPHSAALLLTRMNDISLAHHELVHAIVDAHFSAAARVHVVALDVDTDPLAHFDSIAVLARDVHDRGTFTGADRAIAMRAGSSLSASLGVTRVRLGDDTSTAPLPVGIDELTGASASLSGHYGVSYRITAHVDDAGDIAVLANPRAGAYAGAAIVSGEVVDVVANDASDAVLLAIVPAGGDVDVTIMPPGASSLPMDLLFAPLQ